MSTVLPREGVGALASVRQVPPGILAGAIIPTMVGVAETYFISFLGTEALTGVTLVCPVLMLVRRD
ncbi:hypothetical protein [Insolitispirillum peregrinum]|uniref:hypothetical protein n=1 Tax=Insolitispirillum peregrinum TaxID=80876 RepID=UPI00361CDB4A